MLVFLNGRFVPQEQAVVSVFDRGFLYGDGLFETLRIRNGQPFRWAQHLHRLQRGAEWLGIPLPFPPASLLASAAQLIRENQMPEALLRLTLSRGVGLRGYSPKGANSPSLVMSLHPAPALDPEHPPRWRLVTSSVRLPANEPLTQFKTCNKLPQIVARAQADAAGADDALLLNTDGHVVEAASSNLFWCQAGAICTPPSSSGILPGVTREVVFELCRHLDLRLQESTAAPDALRRAEGVFLSLSSVGIVEVAAIDGHALQSSPLTNQIRRAYLRALEQESTKK